MKPVRYEVCFNLKKVQLFAPLLTRKLLPLSAIYTVLRNADCSKEHPRFYFYFAN